MFKHEEIIAALLKEERTGGSNSNSRYLTNEGWVAGTPNALQRGSYSGRAGTIKRSNKGRTFRAANGTRRYLIDYASEVIAYVP